MRIDGGAEDRHAGFLQARGEVQRRLAAELDDHAFARRPRLRLRRSNGLPFRRSQMFSTSSCVSGSKKSRSLVS